MLSRKKQLKRNPPPAPIQYEMEKQGCVFPDPSTTSETRTFQVGDNVCIRNFKKQIVPGKYLEKVDNDYHRVSVSKGIVSMHHLWRDLGKFESDVEELALEQLSRQKNLPEDVEKQMKGFLGKGRKTRRRLTRRRRNRK